tara:strand:- start:93 stop:365 length:273 start_codon:yes stop_codon:yes gene_type:complete
MNYDIELDRIDTTDDIITRMRAIIESLAKVQRVLYDIDNKIIKSNAVDANGKALNIVSVKLETNGTLTFTMDNTVDNASSDTKEITNVGT